MKSVGEVISTVRKVRTKVREVGLCETSEMILLVLTWKLHALAQKRLFKRRLRKSLSQIGFPLFVGNSFKDIREMTLRYVEGMRVRGGPYGRYRYSEVSDLPLLYSSIYAAMTRHLYRDLVNLESNKRLEWIEYIQMHQREDGLYVDPLVENDIAETHDGWGWKHLTAHALVALACLGAKSNRKISYIEPFYDSNCMSKWLDNCAWVAGSDDSNAVHHIGAYLLYARDFQQDQSASQPIEALFNWLDRHADPASGLWGGPPETPADLDILVRIAYHMWILYFYERRPIPYTEQAIDSVLSNQSELGGFGANLNTSACQDIDSIAPLVWFSHMTRYRLEDIRKSLQRALPWVLANMNADGGFVFQRGVPLTYGHPLMRSETDQSAMFPTWFRSLCLAYLTKAPFDIWRIDFSAQFIHCPVLQTWWF